MKPQPAPEIRTCYCGTTATVVPGTFPHPDCDGSAPQPAAASASQVRRHAEQRDAPELRATLAALLAGWREELAEEPMYPDQHAVHGQLDDCANALAAVLGQHPEAHPAPELAAAESRQLEETRERLGLLEDGIGNLAAGLKLSADASRPSKKSGIEDGCAAALLGLLDPR